VGKSARGRFRGRYRRWRERWYPRRVSVWVSQDEFVLLWSTRTGFVLSAVIRRFVLRDADGQRREIWSAIHEGPMKRKERQKLVGGMIHARDEKLSKLFPLLHDWMTAAKFESDDETREAPTLTMWAQGGQWRLSLRDRAEHLVMWLVGDTVLEVLKLAESFCQDEQGPWRVDDVSNDRHGKRAKGH
jgi:hypothetical protein